MIISYNDYLEHHGRKGMHWYQHIYGKEDSRAAYNKKQTSQKDDLMKSQASDLSDRMKNEIRYSEFKTLKSHDQVAKDRSGDCHAQVMYEYEELKKIGLKPKAKFFMEYNPKTNQGGQTHSFIYYKDKGKYNWFENAWGGQEGIHEYDDYKSMISDVSKRYNLEKTTDRKQFSKLAWGNFNPDKHKPGEDLQTLVDICLSDGDEREQKDRVKHSISFNDYLDYYGRS